ASAGGAASPTRTYTTGPCSTATARSPSLRNRSGNGSHASPSGTNASSSRRSRGTDAPPAAERARPPSAAATSIVAPAEANVPVYTAASRISSGSGGGGGGPAPARSARSSVSAYRTMGLVSVSPLVSTIAPNPSSVSTRVEHVYPTVLPPWPIHRCPSTSVRSRPRPYRLSTSYSGDSTDRPTSRPNDSSVSTPVPRLSSILRYRPMSSAV